MNISRKELYNSTVLVTISQNIDHQDRDLLEHFLVSALKETETTVLIDMSEVTYICSADISIFVNLFNKASSMGKKVFICNPSSIIKKTIEFTNTSTICPLIQVPDYNTYIEN